MTRTAGTRATRGSATRCARNMRTLLNGRARVEALWERYFRALSDASRAASLDDGDG
ncbi:hypothetical protein [Paraburkholderia graminis]|uniref:Uncharacterized protein n=1 Tax=Paraburkholderia graminis TaxID=60548 RepID=A0ABD5CS94_9BURK|nr:hypothetical protein [Paraburkholderia graminis]MDR6208105.1 hypothetical protein [Paraburkholderia graminis]